MDGPGWGSVLAIVSVHVLSSKALEEESLGLGAADSASKLILGVVGVLLIC